MTAATTARTSRTTSEPRSKTRLPFEPVYVTRRQAEDLAAQHMPHRDVTRMKDDALQLALRKVVPGIIIQD